MDSSAPLCGSVLTVVLSLTLGLGAAVAGIALGRRLRPDGSTPLTDGSDE
ncbi:hypothetical protein [Microcella alkaliphila]|nr:hypothetical protein [Microcella alkaliphila]